MGIDYKITQEQKIIFFSFTKFLITITVKINVTILKEKYENELEIIYIQYVINN